MVCGSTVQKLSWLGAAELACHLNRTYSSSWQERLLQTQPGEEESHASGNQSSRSPGRTTAPVNILLAQTCSSTWIGKIRIIESWESMTMPYLPSSSTTWVCVQLDSFKESQGQQVVLANDVGSWIYSKMLNCPKLILDTMFVGPLLCVFGAPIL